MKPLPGKRAPEFTPVGLSNFVHTVYAISPELTGKLWGSVYQDRNGAYLGLRYKGSQTSMLFVERPYDYADSAISFIDVESLSERLEKLLVELGIYAPTKDNPLHKKVALQMLYDDSKGNIREAVIKPLLNKAVREPWALSDAAYKSKYVPVVKQVLLDANLVFVCGPDGAKPVCFGKFDPAGRDWDYSHCKSYSSCFCSKICTRDDLLKKLQTGLQIPVCPHVIECQAALK